MSAVTTKSPWYAGGLTFACQECGNCCAGPDEGYVWVTQDEIAAIAEYLRMELPQFRARYIRQVGSRCSLIEQDSTLDCVFLVNDPARPDRRICMIYPVRPTQCRTWPFWSANIRSPREWNRAARRCPGINRGRIFTVQEIQAKAKATDD